ncbi:hypothetical protein AALA22_11595, partial [Anaerovoracaceae bacterium 41-7]
PQRKPPDYVRESNYLNMAIVFRTLWTVYGWRSKRIADFLGAYLAFEEYAEIMAAVAESLGISQQVIEKEVVKEVEVVKEIPCDNIELERTKAQLEVYKGMYEGLLKGLIGHE